MTNVLTLLFLLLTAACAEDVSSALTTLAESAERDAGAHAEHADAGTSHHHASCTAPYAKDPRDDTLSGELVRVVTGDNGTPNDPTDNVYDLLLPQEMLDWLSEQNWIQAGGPGFPPNGSPPPGSDPNR